jgi:hypothetical protein
MSDDIQETKPILGSVWPWSNQANIGFGLILVKPNSTKRALGLVWLLLSSICPRSNLAWHEVQFYLVKSNPIEPTLTSIWLLLSLVWPRSNLVQHGVWFDPDQTEPGRAHIGFSFTPFRHGSIEPLSLLLLFFPLFYLFLSILLLFMSTTYMSRRMSCCI